MAASVFSSTTLAETSGIVDKVKSLFHHNQSSTGSESAVDDSTCVYHWASLSCKPEASCSIQYHFGDVTPSEACRVSDTSDSTRIPQQFHLAFAGEETGTGMTISWTTFNLEEDPAVWLGSSESTLARVKNAEIETKSYYKEDDYELYSYHAVVTGLKPNKEYFYKEYHIFQHASALRRRHPEARIEGGVVSELVELLVGQKTGRGVTFGLVVANQHHVGHPTHDVGHGVHVLVVHLLVEEPEGGFSREESVVSIRDVAQVIDKVDFIHQRVYVLVRLHGVGISAHISIDSNGKWTLVATLPSSGERTHCALEPFGRCARVYGNFGGQLAWLEEDLKAADANRDQVPWLIVGMHRPMYTIRSCAADGTPNNDFEALNVQEAFEKLLIKYKVDLVLKVMSTPMNASIRRRAAGRSWTASPRTKRLTRTQKHPKDCTSTNTRSLRSGTH
ncbi:hypothetical protein V7S43_014249 [Phytophthora oleae]|uniref:Purple acid phosphatase N-terminal domain-containing protein n=1 Tax=Phytophthora oleae TaxID=2107226 RepID=A0ABD3F4B7_9STRA